MFGFTDAQSDLQSAVDSALQVLQRALHNLNYTNLNVNFVHNETWWPAYKEALSMFEDYNVYSLPADWSDSQYYDAVTDRFTTAITKLHVIRDHVKVVQNGLSREQEEFILTHIYTACGGLNNVLDSLF